MNRFVRSTYLHFASLVDTSKDPAFLCSVSYGPRSDKEARFMSELGSRVGLDTFTGIPFAFQQQDQEKEGRITLAYVDQIPRNPVE